MLNPCLEGEAKALHVIYKLETAKPLQEQKANRDVTTCDPTKTTQLGYCADVNQNGKEAGNKPEPN